MLRLEYTIFRHFGQRRVTCSEFVTAMVVPEPLDHDAIPK